MPFLNDEVKEWIALELQSLGVEDLAVINKDSQNVHAELLLRRIGRVTGDGSIADGVKAIESILDRAGVPRTAYDFADGSGMRSSTRVP